MNKTDLIDFLEENLSIEIEEASPWFGDPKQIKVKLCLNGNCISEDSFDMELEE